MILDSLNIKEATFIVIDFETVTPKGRSPEPIEFAAICIRHGFRIDSEFAIDWLIRPPEGASITRFDTAQTGITWELVKDKPQAADVLKEFDSLLENDFLFVAQNARYEAAIIQRFTQVCPLAAGMRYLDTIPLAKYLFSDLPNYKLDTLANHLDVKIPPDRHRALADVRITADVFVQLLKSGENRNDFGSR